MSDPRLPPEDEWVLAAQAFRLLGRETDRVGAVGKQHLAVLLDLLGPLIRPRRR